MSFDSLGLSEPLVRAVHELGYTTPTPIQTQAIPAVLNGGDLLAGAQTGTGKTAGFTLPILQRLNTMPGVTTASGKRAVRALILTPTRELAAQVEESVRAYGKYLKLKSTVMFGGVGINPQIGALRSGVDIVVATPGRLLDHMQQKTIDLSHLEILVLDEADRMLDMGFIHDIKRVLAKLPPKRQNLLFSATFSDEIKTLADNLLDSPALIEVARRNTTAESVAQKIHPVDRDKKRELLTHLIQQHNWFQVLVFTRTKHGANRLAEQLTKDGINSLAIHGNKSQSARTRALAEFKDNTLQVLVATDIAARGIDIDQLPHVVNFDLPNVPEDYVHRIGRTGPRGRDGRSDFAGVRRRTAIAEGHREADQASGAAGSDRRFRAGSDCKAGADSASWPRRWWRWRRRTFAASGSRRAEARWRGRREAGATLGSTPGRWSATAEAARREAGRQRRPAAPRRSASGRPSARSRA
ncbi:superfamily II DNA/RNA helicase [Paraburkholderia bryophila]|uniref:DEAD-box ATP-dependent RNA helicase RhpA n=1 Tax=Paraburkholderia bryophila TaxID=420952 RepID=A0A7Z0AYL7_9BURK|nr:superfamily II DNA/RNA helicase [Paraburkholderia bryophila]